MKREQVETFVGHPISNAVWLEVCGRLKSIERHPDANAVLDRCIERGLSVEETFDELCRLPSPT
jgi:hypothetical protein